MGTDDFSKQKSWSEMNFKCPSLWFSVIGASGRPRGQQKFCSLDVDEEKRISECFVIFPYLPLSIWKFINSLMWKDVSVSTMFWLCFIKVQHGIFPFISSCYGCCLAVTTNFPCALRLGAYVGNEWTVIYSIAILYILGKNWDNTVLW